MTVGVGLFFQHVEIGLQQKYWLPGEFHTKIEGKDLKPGFSAGLLINVTDKLNFGISYKSKIKHDLNNITVKVEPELPSMGIVDAKADMEFSTPSMVFSGLSYTIGKWTFASDIYWTEWSVQNKLIAHTDSSLFGDITLNKDWKDSLTYGLGIQYSLSETINIYAGYIIDKSPVPSKYLDPIVFHEDSQVFCLGMDYRYNSLTFRMAFGHIKSSDQDFNNSVGDSPNPGGGRVTGTFVDCSQNVLSLSLSYMF
jgi:long-chain fatty acid transport protein